MTTISRTTATVLICDYKGTISAQTGTVEGGVTYTSHGLNVDDFIVNTTQNNTSRRILTATTDSFTVVSVSGQTSSDIIRTYAFTDHTSKLLSGSLKVLKKIEEDTEVYLTIKSDGTYVPRVGQYIRVKVNNVIVFTGFIRSVIRRLPQNGVDEEIFFDLDCSPLKYITPRRTLDIQYDAGEVSGDIVVALTNNFLVAEGFASGTILSGATLKEDWNDDSLSISDIMDSLSAKSGYQWFVDNQWKMQFYQDVTVSAYSQSISDIGTPAFTDYRDVSLEETIENYNNKVFYAGNVDDRGNIIIVSQETTASILEVQDYSAGSGVYGTVVRDAGMTNYTLLPAGAGTDETTIVYPNIEDYVDNGDLIFNTTLYNRQNVTSVSGNTVTIATAIAGQTAGDVIALYPEINDVVDNHLKRSDVLPRILKFNSYTTDFEPAQTLQVALSKLSASTTETYLIESVKISDRGGGYFVANVKASRRNASDVSTQKTPDYKDYFREF